LSFVLSIDMATIMAIDVQCSQFAHAPSAVQSLQPVTDLRRRSVNAAKLRTTRARLTWYRYPGGGSRASDKDVGSPNAGWVSEGAPPAPGFIRCGDVGFWRISVDAIADARTMKATVQDCYAIVDRACRVKEAALIIAIIFDLFLTAITFGLTWSSHIPSALTRVMWFVLTGHALDIASLVTGIVTTGLASSVHIILGVIALGCDFTCGIYRIIQAARCNDNDYDACVFPDNGVYVDWVGAFFTTILGILALSNIFLILTKIRAQKERDDWKHKMTDALQAEGAPAEALVHDTAYAPVRQRISSSRLTFS
jgi:hypothetical protein